MSIVEIRMPQWGMGMTEGTVTRWYRGVGDTCTAGEPLLEVEAAKSMSDVEAPVSGVLESIDVAEGETCKVRTLLATIAEHSTDRLATPSSPPRSTNANGASRGSEYLATQTTEGFAHASGTATQFVSVSPVVRRLAARNGITLSSVTASGPHGRILRADVDAAIAAGSAGVARTQATVHGAAASPAAAAATATAVTSDVAEGDAIPGDLAGQDAATTIASAATSPRSPNGVASAVNGVERVPVTAMRRTVAARLTQSEAVPHFYVKAAVDVEALMALRAQIGTDRPDARVSVTDLVIRACATALRLHPQMNAAWDGDAIVRHAGVHIGLAVSLDDGLVVPVIRDADTLGVARLAAETRDLAARARSRGLQPEQMSGSTFTVSNLGMCGVEEFTAVLNPPEAAILAVGAARPQVVVCEDEVVVRSMMSLVLTVDHRVADGAVAGRFVATLTELLQRPFGLLV